MSKTLTYTTLTIAAGGVTQTYPITDAIDIHVVKASGGAVVLAGNVSIAASGTPVYGSTYTFLIGGGFTLGANTFTVFGATLTAAQALYKQTVLAFYNGSSWDVFINSDDTDNSDDVNGADIVDASITGAKLAAATISLSKMANLAARGYLIRGGVNGALEGVNAVTSGNLVMGNGTDVVSQAMSGDVTINGSGVATIGAGKVTAAMLNFTITANLEASLTIPAASVLTLNATPLTIVAAPGSGKYIEVISASSSMTFVSAAYATNTTLRLINDGATIPQLQDTAILLSSVTKNTKFKDVTSAAAGQTQIITNTALKVDVATGNPTAGDSILIVKVVYRIVTI